MEKLFSLSQDKRLRNHLNVDKRRRSNQHSQSSPHFHSYFEMYFMEEGSCKFFLKENVYDLKTGEFLLIPPGELHLASYEAEGFHDRFIVYFDMEMLTPDLLPFISFHLEDASSPVHYQVEESFQENLFTILDRMLEAYRMENEYGDHLNRHLFPVLMMLLAKRSAPVEEGRALSELENALARTTRYLSEHFREPLSLDEAAAMAGFSPSYYSRKFKEVVGISFREYLTHLRLKEAASLLRRTSLSIQEISDQCGFTSANYFGDVFRSMFHLSPRQYRQMEEVSQ